MIKETRDYWLGVCVALLGFWLGGLFVAAKEYPKEFILMDLIRTQSFMIAELEYALESERSIANSCVSKYTVCLFGNKQGDK